MEAPPGIPQRATSHASRPSPRTETPPPLGFDFNCGSNYVPCLVTLDGGRCVPACYVHVVMSNDPYIISIVPGDDNHYGLALHAEPCYDIDQFQCPCYHTNDLWHLKYGVDEAEEFDEALSFLHDHLLTAEVHRYHEAGMLEVSYKADIKKLEDRMWAAGTMKEASVRHLERANALAHIEVSVAELRCRRAQRERQPSINNPYSDQPTPVVACRRAL